MFVPHNYLTMNRKTKLEDTRGQSLTWKTEIHTNRPERNQKLQRKGDKPSYTLFPKLQMFTKIRKNIVSIKKE